MPTQFELAPMTMTRIAFHRPPSPPCDNCSTSPGAQVVAQDDYEDTSFAVELVPSSGKQAAAALAVASVDTASVTLEADASFKQLVADAMEVAEELKSAAATKLQAWVRGRHVRQRRARMEKSAITLQRAFRRLRGSQGRRKHSAAVEAGMRQREAWAMEFQRAAGEGGLEKSGFLQALKGACGEKVSEAQASALWAGFLEQREADEPMLLSTFRAICEAVLKGDARAAEFAGLAEEEYRDCTCSAPIADGEVPAKLSRESIQTQWKAKEGKEPAKRFGRITFLILAVLALF